MSEALAPPSAPLTILHLAAPARVGGLERVVHALAVGHTRRGHQVHVGAILEPHERDHPFVTALRAETIPVHEVALPSRAYRRERAIVAQLCARLKPDVVHTHGYRPDVMDAGVARGLGIATVTTVHGFTGGAWRNRLYERLQVMAFRRFDAVVAVSRPLADLLSSRGVRPPRLTVVPNAWSPAGEPSDRVAARQALGVATDSPRIGFVGRLTAEKGADVLVEALPQLGDRARVSIIGEGPERPALEARAVALGVDRRITWHGMVPDAGRLLRAFDVLVISSRTEGTPIALFEAMAAGVPVVVSAVGGIPDVVSAQEALLVPPEQPRALASAIQSALADRDGSARRSGAARDRLARDFDAARWLAQYEGVYGDAGARAAARRS